MANQDTWQVIAESKEAEIAKLKAKLNEVIDSREQYCEWLDNERELRRALEDKVLKRNTQIADLKYRLEKAEKIPNILLSKLEVIRKRKQYQQNEPTDYIIRLCEAEIAEMAGYKARSDWEGKI